MSKKSRVGRTVPGRMNQVARPSGPVKTEGPAPTLPPAGEDISVLITPDGTEIAETDDLAADVDYQLSKATKEEVLVVQVHSLHQRLMVMRKENIALQAKVGELEIALGQETGKAFLKEHGLGGDRKMKKDSAENWWWIDAPPPAPPSNNGGNGSRAPEQKAPTQPPESKPAEPPKA